MHGRINVGLQIEKRLQQPGAQRGVAGRDDPDAVEIQQQRQRRWRNNRRGRPERHARPPIPDRSTDSAPKRSAVRRNARRGQAFVAAGGRGEAACRIVLRDDRHGVGVEMVGVFVGQDHQVAMHVFRVDRRQRKPLEAEQPLDGVGKIGIDVNDLAGRRFEGEARLAEPPHPNRPLRHAAERIS